MIRGAMAVAPASATGVNLVAREARFPRLVALLLDTIFISVVTLVATNVYGVTVVTSGSAIPNSGFATWSSETAIPGVATAGIWLVYYTLCEALFGATPGKALNGLIVVSADGRRLTAGRVVIRNVLRLIDALPLAYLLGGFFVLTTGNSQRIGDLAARTTVVLRRRVLDPDITRSSGRTARRVLVVAVAALVVFTAFFDYFGRPALVIQSAYNEHRLLPDSDVVGYSLGTPTRTLTTVTYPVTAQTPTQRCTGSISLTWEGLFGWQMSGASVGCSPAS